MKVPPEGSKGTGNFELCVKFTYDVTAKGGSEADRAWCKLCNQNDKIGDWRWSTKLKFLCTLYSAQEARLG